MQPKKFTGKLIAIDMYNCGVNEVNDTEKAKTLLQEGCDEYRMNSHELLVCQEEGQSEYSISAPCKQGHVTLHVYPKLGFIAADIFSCYDAADPAGMARYLRSAFDCDKAKITLLDRGDFGSKYDMKPNHRSNIKFIRRTQNVTKNVGAQLKKMMLKPRGI